MHWDKATFKSLLKSPILFNFIIISILVIGIYFRVSNLTTNPIGFFADEASIGFNAYTLLTKGVDENGVPWPLFFRAFGEYKGPIEIYTTIPFISIFGLNEFSVRLVSAFFSILTIPVMYFIGKVIKDKYLGLILMLIFALTPWSIHLARVHLSSISQMIFLFSCGLLFYFKYLNSKVNKHLIGFVIIMGICSYSYFPIRIIIIPFILFALFLLILDHINIKKTLAVFVIYLIILLPLIQHMVFGSGLSRWQQVSVFSEKKSPTEILSKVTKSYLLHFSSDYLFIKGDAGMTGQFINRHSILGLGELQIWQIVIIPIGVLFLVKDSKWRLLSLLIGLLLLYPIPSSLTVDIPPQATRSAFGMIPLTLITGYGLYRLLMLIKGKPILFYSFSTLVFIIICLSIFKTNLLLKEYPAKAYDYWSWQYGFPELVYSIRKYDSINVKLKITNRFNGPQELLKFYNVKYQCITCMIAENPISINTIENAVFAVRVEEVTEFLKSNKAYGFNTFETIPYPNQTPAFVIGQFIHVSDPDN